MNSFDRRIEKYHFGNKKAQKNFFLPILIFYLLFLFNGVILILQDRQTLQPLR